MDMIDIKTRLTAVLLAAILLLSGCAETNTSSGAVVIDGGTYSTTAPKDETPDELTSISEIHEQTTASDIEEATDTTTVTSDTTEPTSEAVTTPPETSAPASEIVTPPPETSAPVTSETTSETTASTASITETSESTPTATTPVETTTKTPETTAPISPTEVFAPNSYKALNYSEVKGVWLSYLELNIMLNGKTEKQFRTNIAQAFDNAVLLGLNTVYVHVRSFSDAFYKSELFPWSSFVTGTLADTPDFDPLEIMLEEAHSRKLSFQAWINPLRGCTVSSITAYPDSYALKKWHNDAATKGKYVVPVGSYYFLNPAYNDVIKLITDGAAEIVSKYDVDGVHIDDYFYPTTDASFDSSAYSESSYTTLSTFRFANCDKLVKGLYDAVKSVNTSALFGVSCQGSIENNYNNMYADVEKWCGTKGYTDYIAPQIYYGFNNSTQPYETCVSRWQELVKDSGIPLIAGLSVYKVGAVDEWAGAGKYEWQTDTEILKRQLDYIRGKSNYGGVILYSYNSIYSPSADTKASVDKEIKAFKDAL